MTQWLEREFTDRKIRGSNPTSASRLLLSRLGQPGSIPALVLPSSGMAARHRKGYVKEENISARNFLITCILKQFSPCIPMYPELPHPHPRHHLHVPLYSEISCCHISVNGGLIIAVLLYHLRQNLQVSLFECLILGARWRKWLERELTDRKVRGSNPTSASRLLLSRLGQPGSIPALVLPSGGTAARHRKGVTAERFFIFFLILIN
ncbi:hypothetical protein CSKR_107478 [Clonorchis sinensis]|uniref:Uncharacterized protein n=1 Tax=Clonorchis sinensis TaxID=79923 RepID=A0A419PY73_CLOSI|nr:hypothetical protein CSKR_107478 [Clonorchis sinensis]